MKPRAKMSLEQRAKQFAPFAALRGHQQVLEQMLPAQPPPGKKPRATAPLDKYSQGRYTVYNKV